MTHRPENIPPISSSKSFRSKYMKGDSSTSLGSAGSGSRMKSTRNIMKSTSTRRNDSNEKIRPERRSNRHLNNTGNTGNISFTGREEKLDHLRRRSLSNQSRGASSMKSLINLSTTSAPTSDNLTKRLHRSAGSTFGTTGELASSSRSFGSVNSEKTATTSSTTKDKTNIMKSTSIRRIDSNEKIRPERRSNRHLNNTGNTGNISFTGREEKRVHLRRRSLSNQSRGSSSMKSLINLSTTSAPTSDNLTKRLHRSAGSTFGTTGELASSSRSFGSVNSEKTATTSNTTKDKANANKSKPKALSPLASLRSLQQHEQQTKSRLDLMRLKLADANHEHSLKHLAERTRLTVRVEGDKIREKLRDQYETSMINLVNFNRAAADDEEDDAKAESTNCMMEKKDAVWVPLQKGNRNRMSELSALSSDTENQDDDNDSLQSSSSEESDDLSLADQEALAISLDRFKKRINNLSGSAEQPSNYYQRRYGGGRQSTHVIRASDYLFDLSNREDKNDDSQDEVDISGL